MVGAYNGKFNNWDGMVAYNENFPLRRRVSGRRMSREIFSKVKETFSVQWWSIEWWTFVVVWIQSQASMQCVVTGMEAVGLSSTSERRMIFGSSAERSFPLVEGVKIVKSPVVVLVCAWQHSRVRRTWWAQWGADGCWRMMTGGGGDLKSGR